MRMSWRRRIRGIGLATAMSLGAWVLGPWTVMADDGVTPVDVWTTHGPYTGSPRALAIDPTDLDTVYAAFSNDVYKSVDGGAHWFPVLRTPAIMNDVAVDPFQPTTVYAAGKLGVFKSLDGGTTWVLTNEGLPARLPDPMKVFLDPSRPETLFITVGPNERLYRSRDGGRTWAPSRGLRGAVNDLAFVSGEPPHIYAATGLGGVYESTDGGDSWSPTDGPDVKQSLNTILVISEPGKPLSFFIGTHIERFRSTDGGATWTDFGDPDMYVRELVADPRTPATLYAGTAFGAYKSQDGGDSWSWLEGPGAGYVFDLTVVAEQGYVSTKGGVFRTTDGGGHWQEAGEGLPINLIGDLVAHPLQANVVYGLSDFGLMKSEDRGGSWQAIGTGWPHHRDEIANLVDLAIDPEEPRRMYVAVRPAGIPENLISGGLYRSDDGGATWSIASNGLPVFTANTYFEAQHCEAVALDPRDPRTVYCLAYVGSGIVTVYKSRDGADHWEPSGDGLPDRVHLFQPHPTLDRLYAVSLLDGFYASDNRGATWRPLNAAFPERDITFFAPDPDHRDVVYAASLFDPRRLLIRSEDGGVNWQSTQEGLPGPVEAMAFTSSAIFAGTTDGVYKSEDDGRTWQAFKTGMPSATWVTALIVHPLEPHRLYAGTYSQGIFQLNRLPALYLQNGRFRIEVLWNTDEETGFGKPVTLSSAEDGTVPLRSDATSVVQFFGPNNWEMILKVLDARRQNGHHWVLLSATTNVAYTVTVEDTSCGATKIYENPLGTTAPAILDNKAFAECSSPVSPDCQEDETTLCLGPDRRFRARIVWTDARGATGFGRQVEVPAGVSRSKSSALFYFFGPNNWELLIKVLDGCRVNGRYWVFGTSPTNVGYTIRVIDTVSNETQEYVHPRGTAAPAIIDTGAFSCGPP